MGQSKTTKTEGLWLYISKDSGITVSIFGLVVLVIIFVSELIFYLISRRLPIFGYILGSFRIHLFGLTFSLVSLWPWLLLFYGFKVLDGFIEGVPIVILDIGVLGIFYFFGFRNGILIISTTVSSIIVTMAFDFTWIFWAILIGYIWVLIGEIWVFWSKFQIRRNSDFPKLKKKIQTGEIDHIESTESGVPSGENINEHIFQTHEAHLRKWVNKETEQILLQQYEKPLRMNWVPLKAELKENLTKIAITDMVGYILVGGIFALLTGIFTGGAVNNFNAISTAFAFPLWIILAYAVRSPAYYIRALISIIIVFEIQLALRIEGLITVEGFFLLGPIITVSKYFFFDLAPYLNGLTSIVLTEVYFRIVGIILSVQFVIMVVNALTFEFQIQKPMQFLPTNQHLFLRRPRTFNNYIILYNFLMARFWPFNVETYWDLIKQFKYKRESSHESWLWDYGRLDYTKSIKKLQKMKTSIVVQSLKAVLLGAFATYTFQYYIGYFLLFAALWQLWPPRFQKYQIRIKFWQKQSKGSIFILSKENILSLYNVDEEMAEIIPPEGITF